MLTALAGGVGAARFLRGLVDVVAPGDVTVVVNTGDDDEFHGLCVCPDLDSVTYTLAGATTTRPDGASPARRSSRIDALDRYGAPTWFRLGDRDLATHLFRTAAPARGRHAPRGDRRDHGGAGASTSALLPMTDDRVATRITVARSRRRASASSRCRSGSCGERSEPPVRRGALRRRRRTRARRPACSRRSRPPTRSSSARATR